MNKPDAGMIPLSIDFITNYIYFPVERNPHFSFFVLFVTIIKKFLKL